MKMYPDSVISPIVVGRARLHTSVCAKPDGHPRFVAATTARVAVAVVAMTSPKRPLIRGSAMDLWACPLDILDTDDEFFLSWRRRRRGTSAHPAFFLSLILGLFLLVVVNAVLAQSASTGALTGTVTEPTGAVVQNAKITFRNYATNETLTATSGQDGLYRLSLLPPGEYELTVEAAGFSPLVMREVTIQITEVRTIGTQLAVKGAREEVVVKAPVLQTDDAALGRVVDRGTIVALPLVNRNYTQILGLTAGTNTDVVDATQLGAGSQEIRANGARSGDNNFMLNGVDANSYGANMTEATPNSGGGLSIPAPDTIREFKVQNSLYDAQYGRGGGANVLVETRSGTAELHGNA